MNLTNEHYVKSIMYVSEIGDLVALYSKDGQQYLVCWADYDSNANWPATAPGDIYTVVEVNESKMDSYLTKQITGYEIQKNAATIFVGTYQDGVLVATESSFSELEAKGFTMAEGTSFYDEILAPYL